MNNDLVTIVTVSFNERDNLIKTMEPVLTQPYRPLEYIVVDGDSTDGSYQRAMDIMIPKAEELGIILKCISSRYRVQMHKECDVVRGIPHMFKRRVKYSLNTAEKRHSLDRLSYT